jgi:hypothetical protein
MSVVTIRAIKTVVWKTWIFKLEKTLARLVDCPAFGF